MTKRVYKSIDDLPEVLDVIDIRSFLHISKSSAYELVASGQFHVVKIGRVFKIPKKAFVEWFQGSGIA